MPLRRCSLSDRRWRLHHSLTMNASGEPPSPRGLGRIRRGLSARAGEVPTFEQSALQRARVDTSAWVERASIRFHLVAAGTAGGAGVLGAALAAALPIGVQITVAIASSCLGFLAPLAVLFTTAWVVALPRQRDEAREEIKVLTQPADLSQFALDFSDWVAEKRAGLPRYEGFSRLPSIFHDDPKDWSAYERRRDDTAKLQAQARSEYHQRFRRPVVAVLGAQAEDPDDITALVELSEKLSKAADEEQRAKRLVAAHGSFVGEQQRVLLESLLNGVRTALASSTTAKRSPPTSSPS